MKKAKKIIAIAILVIILPILFISVVILISSYANKDKVPSFFGYKPFIVLSGSMETEIYSGDVVVVKEVDTSTLKENDIIAYKVDNNVIVHRIVSIEVEDGETKYITKGDNNNANDNNYVLPSQVEGIYDFRLKGIGNVAIFLQTPGGIIVGLAIPVLLLILLQTIDSKNNKKQIKNSRDREEELKKEIEKLKRERDSKN